MFTMRVFCYTIVHVYNPVMDFTNTKGNERCATSLSTRYLLFTSLYTGLYSVYMDRHFLIQLHWFSYKCFDLMLE